MSTLESFNVDEFEFFTDSETGECFTSARGYSRLSGVNLSIISKRVGGDKLIGLDQIADWLAKDNPVIARELLKAGIKSCMQTLGGQLVHSASYEEAIELMLSHRARVKLLESRVRELEESK
ncbi:hypothetical protein H6G93_09330 [Nostoc sp. FACHB-973]|nr:hypothetical protein [Nostoc sp. FACHB-973]